MLHSCCVLTSFYTKNTVCVIFYLYLNLNLFQPHTGYAHTSRLSACRPRRGFSSCFPSKGPRLFQAAACLTSSVPRLLKGAEEIVTQALRSKSVAQLGKTLSVSSNLASLNHERYKKFLVGATAPREPDEEGQTAARQSRPIMAA